MYSKIIDEPMDLSTMAKKIDNYQYKCFAAFEYDVELICRNCCHYNGSSTIFYKLGQEYRTKTLPFLKNVAKKIKEERFNTATGKHENSFQSAILKFQECFWVQEKRQTQLLNSNST